jgi:hypothetical protein
MKFITQLFSIDKSPKRGLLALEWLVMAYTVFTLLVALFTYTNLQNPDAMIWGRVRVVAMTVALWLAYRLVPCRLTLLARVVAQMSLLAWWYPDTYELNRMFPNLDHVFCRAEQSMFGFQPSLSFASTFSWAPISELMSMGYAAYYPMIGLMVFFYFFARYNEFQRASFILLASFFIYYIVFIFVPVAGPTFYFKAVGLENIANGFFPAVGTYFNTHQECLPTPGYVDGFFYDLVEQAKAAGERPTAAFLVARRRIDGVHVACISRTQPPSALLHDTVLRVPVSCHGVHPGTLRHRCPCRTRQRHSALLHPAIRNEGDKMLKL